MDPSQKQKLVSGKQWDPKKSGMILPHLQPQPFGSNVSLCPFSWRISARFRRQRLPATAKGHSACVSSRFLVGPSCRYFLCSAHLLDYQHLHLVLVLVIALANDISLAVELHIVTLCGVHLHLPRQLVLRVIPANLCTQKLLLRSWLVAFQNDIAAGVVGQMKKPMPPLGPGQDIPVIFCVLTYMDSTPGNAKVGFAHATTAIVAFLALFALFKLFVLFAFLALSAIASLSAVFASLHAPADLDGTPTIASRTEALHLRVTGQPACRRLLAAKFCVAVLENKRPTQTETCWTPLGSRQHKQRHPGFKCAIPHFQDLLDQTVTHPASLSILLRRLCFHQWQLLQPAGGQLRSLKDGPLSFTSCIAGENGWH